MKFSDDIEAKEYILKLNKVLNNLLEIGETIIKVENTTGGIANKVIKLTTNIGKKYILKIYKKQRNQTLPFELMKFLRQHGINVIFPKNNNPIIFENEECYLYDYIDNIPTVFDNNMSSHLIKLLNTLSDFKTNIDSDEYYYTKKCDYEYKLLKEKEKYILDHKIINKVLNRYEEIKELPINNKKEIVHSDISKSNLLTTNRGYYLIDFDETRFCSKLYDLSVILVKFFFDKRNIDIEGARKFVNLYLDNFKEYSYDDCYNVFEYYIVKQLLEKFSDYEIYNINIYSEQQQQDDFRNWIYYFNNLNYIRQIFN